MSVLMPEPKGTQLGHATKYAETYAPSLLFPISRNLGRDAIGAHDFRGTDLWRLYEFTWLSPSGLPVAAEVELSVPAATPNIIESKSLKLYAMSFAMSTFSSADEVRTVLERDLSAAAGGKVGVMLNVAGEWQASVHPAPGKLLEIMVPDTPCTEWEVNPQILVPAGASSETVTWSTNLFRSLCPVTDQPDFASVSVTLKGAMPSPSALLTYLVSYRRHKGFHEQCVEQIFNDLATRIHPDVLEVRAAFTRRGGIDINPFRSSVRDTLLCRNTAKAFPRDNRQ